MAELIRKTRMFNKFSKNLSHLFEIFRTDIKTLPEGEYYLCPLGFSLHKIDELNNGHQSTLTEEHVPAKSLGGKSICLTRRDLNSISGHTLDHRLLEYTQFQSFIKRKGRFKTKLNFNLPSLSHLHAEVNLKKDEKGIMFTISSKSMRLLEREITQENIRVGLKQEMILRPPIEDWQFSVALLKTAYLLAFSKVGNALLFGIDELINKEYQKIRDQIADPSQRIVSSIPYLKQSLFKNGGLGIITSPVEMQALIVSFSLTTNNHTDEYTVFLPGPQINGFEALDQIQKSIDNRIEIKFDFTELPEIPFEESAEATLLFYRIWCKLTQKVI